MLLNRLFEKGCLKMDFENGLSKTKFRLMDSIRINLINGLPTSVHSRRSNMQLHKLKGVMEGFQRTTNHNKCFKYFYFNKMCPNTCTYKLPMSTNYDYLIQILTLFWNIITESKLLFLIFLKQSFAVPLMLAVISKAVEKVIRALRRALRILFFDLY